MPCFTVNSKVFGVIFAGCGRSFDVFVKCNCDTFHPICAARFKENFQIISLDILVSFRQGFEGNLYAVFKCNFEKFHQICAAFSW